MRLICVSAFVFATTLLVGQTLGEFDFDINQRHETQVNTFTKSSQSAPSICSHVDGGFTVTWHSRRQQQGTYGVYAQRYSADGKAIGGERQVNLFTKSMQMNPAIAADAAGGVWIAWESFGQDGSFNAIIARRFDGDNFTGSDEILVNQYIKGNQHQVVATSGNDTSMTFFWVSQNEEGTKKRIVGRSFNFEGKPISDEFVVSESNNHQSLPSVSANDNRIVCAWSEQNSNGQPAGIFARILNFDGSEKQSPFKVCSTKEDLPIEPSVAISKDGGFALSWLQFSGREHEVMYRRFDANSKPLHEPIRASVPGTPYVNGTAIESMGMDRYLVTWNQQTDRFGKDRNIFGQIFDHSERHGSIFAVNASTEGHHLLEVASGKRRLAWNEKTNRIHVVWSGSNKQDKSSVNLTTLTPSQDLFAFSKPVNIESSTDVDSAKPHEPPTYDPKLVAKEPFGGVSNLGPSGNDFGFVAINATGWNPPDPELAVGPNHIVAMTNGAIAFFDKSGTLTFSDEIENSFGFWGAQGATGFVFDPEVLFDPHSQRFFAMANERGNNRSYFLLAVSDDDDPNGSWNKYRFDVTDISGNDIDSPNMAVDDEVVYLSADFFGPDQYLVYMIRKSDLITGAATPQTTDLLITGSQSYGLPLIYDADAPAFYMLQAFEFGNFSTVRMHAITNPLTNPQRVTTDVSVPAYGHPQDPQQQGSSSRPELFEARFWSCVYRNGSLWAVHHHSPNSSGLPRVRWYEFDVRGWPASGMTPQLVQSGELTPLNDQGQQSSTFFPSIWVDENGNAAITMARSSSSEFISMSRAVRAANDAPDTFQEVQLVQPSTSIFTGGRWGDYSATNSDPVLDNTFWGIHEFAQSNGVWQTFIAQYIVENGTTTILPSSASAENGTIASGGVAALAESDDQYFSVLAAPPQKESGEEVVTVYTGNTVNTDFNSLTFVLETSVNSPNVIQNVELFNFQSGDYEMVDSRAVETTDSSLSLDISGDVSRFVTPGSGLLLARVSFESSGPNLFFPWQVNIDLLEWQISD